MSEEYTGDFTSYNNIWVFYEVQEFKNFVKRHMVDESARLTVQVFAKELTEEDKAHRLESSLCFNAVEYSLVTLNDVKEWKTRDANLITE